MDSEGAKAQGSKKEASHAKHLRPRIDANSRSKLSSREMRERIRENGSVDLDPLKPESSVWLRNILKLLKSKDSEKRFIALHRFAIALLAVSKSTPAYFASFAAYVLEQGVLDEVVRILRAAQHGDFYLVAGAAEDPRETLKKGLFVQSKVEVCFKILYGLMEDSRTVRFIRKAIPDLIDISEGAYLSQDPGFEVPGKRELMIAPPWPSRDDDKEAAIMVLGSLSFWSDQARATILSRKVLLRQILKDCMAGTAFSRRIIDRVITFFSFLMQSPDKFLTLSSDIVEVAFKSLEICNTREVLELAVSILDWIVTKEATNEPLQMTIKARSAEYLNPILALVACPNLKQDRLERSAYNLLRVLDDKIYSSLLNSTQSEEEVDKRLQAQYPKALSRKQQLCRIWPRRVVAHSHLQAGSDFAKTTALSTDEHDHSQKRECIPTVTVYPSCKKPCRKCSRLECANTESGPGQFKVCSGCRLAVYCSRDKPVQGFTKSLAINLSAVLVVSVRI